MKIIQKNKKLNLNYIPVEKHEVGIQLTGIEIKTIKKFGINLDNAYIIFKNNEIFLLNSNVNIPTTIQNNFLINDPVRTRKLLANRREIDKWKLFKQKENLAIIPDIAYLLKGQLKIRIAFCKGRKKQDKRQYLKEKSAKKYIKNYK